MTFLETKSTMSEIAALLLCKLGGKGGSVDEITAVLTAAGLEADADAVSKLVGDIEGKDINELLTAGSEQIKNVPLGGGGGGGGGGGAAGGAAAAEEAKPGTYR